MGRISTIAFAIAARLEEIPELAGKVIVHQRSKIRSEFEMRMKKTRGKCVVIQRQRGRNRSSIEKKVRWQGVYTVSLFTVPLLTQKDAIDSDSLVDVIADKLQGWWPPNVPSNNVMFLHVGDLTFPEDDNYDVSTLIVEAPGSPK